MQKVQCPYGNNRPVQLAVATQVVHFSQIAPEHFLQLSIMINIITTPVLWVKICMTS